MHYGSIIHSDICSERKSLMRSIMGNKIYFDTRFRGKIASEIHPRKCISVHTFIHVYFLYLPYMLGHPDSIPYLKLDTPFYYQFTRLKSAELQS